MVKEPPVNEVLKMSLSAARQRLVELMQEVNFGEILNLEVRQGEPVFAPAPTVVREIKLGSANGPRPELRFRDFKLKLAVVELLDHLDEFADGVVERIEIREGLPCRLRIVEQKAIA